MINRIDIPDRDEPPESVVSTSEYVSQLNTATREMTVFIHSGISHSAGKYKPLIDELSVLGSEYLINLYICTLGGSLQTGYLLCDAFTSSKAALHTHNIGNAFSCGSLLLMMGDKISIAPHAITMFHDASSFSYGGVHLAKSSVEANIANVAIATDGFIEKGVLTEEEVAAINNGREFYFEKEQMDARLNAAGLLIPFGG